MGILSGAYNHSCRKVGTESMKRAVQALRNTVIMASGTTEITNVEYILRGYSDIIHKLTQLGADIQLIEE